MVFAGETISCHATITSVAAAPGGLILDVEQQVRVGDRVAVAPASAEVMVRD
jgi:acyl dehydratase